jgi:AcrR family transcriptional regulator
VTSEDSERTFDQPGPSVGAAVSDARDSYDERLNHILQAATQVIADVGYGQATMRAVAKAAGVSLAGMYHYFDGKEKMLFLIQFRTFNALLQTLQERLHGVTDPFEQLHVMVKSHVGYFAANMAALKVCSHELDALSGTEYEDLRKIRHDYYELTRAIVERIMASHSSNGTVDAHVATMSLFGILNWLYRWYTPGPERSPAGLTKQITQVFLTGVLGDKLPAEGARGASAP